MPICILGMHRSGTSLITRMLNLCGLYIGQQRDMMPPTGDNPDGYWENLKFLDINDEILRRFGGAWDHPPRVPDDWQEQITSARLDTRSTVLLREFDDREPWGWKDPRNSLTLFFWRNLLPDLKIVVCLRNPLEVAASLHRRNDYSLVRSLTLWLEYNERIVAATCQQDRLITHYDAYFQDYGEAELRRLLEFTGLNPPADALQDCGSLTRHDLRHARSFTQQLAQPDIPGRILQLYTAMCEEAGWREGTQSRVLVEPSGTERTQPANESLKAEQTRPSRSDTEDIQLQVDALREQIVALRSELAERDRAIRDLHIRLVAMRGQF
jgi:hypothetical protein